jgi:hypothetical protein
MPASPAPATPTAALSVTYAPPAIAPSPFPTAPIVDFAQYVRAANAVGMMALGLLGSVAGLLAARAAEPAKVR